MNTSYLLSKTKESDRQVLKFVNPGWEPCEIEELEKGDVVIFLKHEDDLLERGQDGCCTFYITKKPVVDSDGEIHLWSMTCASLAALDPEKNAPTPKTGEVDYGGTTTPS